MQPVVPIFDKTEAVEKIAVQIAERSNALLGRRLSEKDLKCLSNKRRRKF